MNFRSLSISLNLIFLCLFMAFERLPGQELNEAQASKDSIYFSFKETLEEFASTGADTSLPESSVDAFYELLFIAPMRFGDPKVHFMRTIAKTSIARGKARYKILGLKASREPSSHFFQSGYGAAVRTTVIDHIWGERLMDSVINLESSPSIWASKISVQAILKIDSNMTKKETFGNKSPDLFAGRQLYGLHEGTDKQVLSYCRGKYLVVDNLLMFSYIGGQTDYGSGITYILRRLED